MNEQNLAQHRQNLHDAFFEDRDQELLDFLEFEAKTTDEQERERMQIAAGIANSEVLQTLKRLGVTSASMTAFMLLPLVRLAWADSKIQDGEFESILKAASDDGIVYGTPCYRLLNRWLEDRPTERMLDAWTKYAQAVARELDESSLNAFRNAILDRVRRVADAAGGILGFGERVSENERHVYQDLARTLSKPPL